MSDYVVKAGKEHRLSQEAKWKYAGKKLHIIIADNLSAHKHESVKEWVSKNKQIELHYTPTYSSWVNQVDLV